MTILPVGEAALLAELPDARSTLALYRRLRGDAGTGSEPAGPSAPSGSAAVGGPDAPGRPVAARASSAAGEPGESDGWDELGTTRDTGAARDGMVTARANRPAGSPDGWHELGTTRDPGAARDGMVAARARSTAGEPHGSAGPGATRGAGAAPAGVVEIVPAARTVLVQFDPAVLSPASARVWLAAAMSSLRLAGTGPEVGAARAGTPGDGGPRLVAPPASEPAAEPIEIAVRYDGPDLAAVAELTGASVDAVIAAHTGQLWTAAFIGFAPGFAYLSGENESLTVPRRVTPRPVVHAGSVGLAAGYCGIYPRESPGGWQLIGTTSATLWDAALPDPALLAPGARVRFVRV
ncbi:carboxyltransferase domain-containing protein [Herbiconiux sp. 11R-BC]|uniref:carboxyltransferase domain-containing protein n=1 Tax=Herbiconiux sp. 11R-BC TaxID=3111637 RepID=UPI003C0D5403